MKARKKISPIPGVPKNENETDYQFGSRIGKTGEQIDKDRFEAQSVEFQNGYDDGMEEYYENKNKQIRLN